MLSIKTLAAAAFVLLATHATESVAGSDLSCLQKLDTNSTTDEKIACLDNQIKELLALNQVTKEQLQIALNRQTEALNARIDSEGALPQVVYLGPFVHRTNGYWGGGAYMEPTICREYERSIEGYSLVEASAELPFSIGRGTCAQAPFCDGAGEYCQDVQVEVCYVKTGVYEKLKARFGFDDARMLAYCRQ